MPQLIWPRWATVVTVFLMLAAASPAQAAKSLREAAADLERQLKMAMVTTANQSFSLPLAGSAVALSGEAKVEVIDKQLCRRTLELVHDQPFEHRGLRITNINRRSVQDGPCRNFADAMAAQADISARSIAVQIGIESGTDPMQAPQQAAPQVSTPSAPATPAVDPTAVMLTVREKAIIRDAPSRNGEKLSRADAGTRLQGWRIAGNPDWFVLDGGLRFISASVVDASDAAARPSPAAAEVTGLRLTVIKSAIVRNAPSAKGAKMASLAAGSERRARRVVGSPGWYELLDSDSRYPLFIHESVVAEKRR